MMAGSSTNSCSPACPWMKPDEGLALLQRGEMVLPRDMVQGFASGLPAGGLHELAALAGSTVPDYVARDLIKQQVYADRRDEMVSQIPLSIHIVATMDPDEVHREMRRNPDTILTVIEQSDRNGGTTRKPRR